MAAPTEAGMERRRKRNKKKRMGVLIWRMAADGKGFMLDYVGCNSRSQTTGIFGKR